MNIYLAGGQRGWRQELEGRHLLVSFAEPRQCALIGEGWDVLGWLLDSGAFTCWRQGGVIDIEAYARFIEAHAGQLDGAIALDVIPGAPGRLPTADEAEAAGEQSLVNLDWLTERLGSIIWPVYHEGEPMAVLDELVRRGYDRIALGATASRGKDTLADWLLPIFDRHPEQGYHGLGMTQARTIRNIPFKSVDSTSWLNFSRYGVAANTYLLKDKSKAFYRSLGIAAILDTETCPERVQATKDGQLRMFPGETA